MRLVVADGTEVATAIAATTQHVASSSAKIADGDTYTDPGNNGAAVGTGTAGEAATGESGGGGRGPH